MKNLVQYISICTIFLFISCTDNNEEIIDNTSPKLFIQSPTFLFNYSTDIGNSAVPYRVNLQAEAADIVEIESLSLKIKDEDDNVIVEKLVKSNSNNKNILRLTEGFQTTKVGVYTAEFTAKDTSGNYTFRSLTFEYND
ncbi:hypothetical protein [Tenacibaculum jejuense]|uniref:Lipoprotein n=1 Tax=Tenacibaculum jejuense TaxID=584609 RepID=A0A238UB22_9FLAO|nr:hypothetical protein [Tenacibaculum jejuense]SNR15610.1 Protein of unknown function [Tenacibaculum jejuense]